MTDQELAAIEARVNAATAGPWEAYCNYDECWTLDGPIANGPDMMPKGDAIFIAHARTDVPALVAEVRRLKWLVREAFCEGFSIQTDESGWSYTERDEPLAWVESDARKAL